MRKLNKPRSLLFVLSLLLLSSCTPTPPDIPVCESLDPWKFQDPVTHHLMMHPSPACIAEVDASSCGHCVYIMSGKEIFVGEKDPHLLNGKPWSVLRDQSVLLPAVESYAPLASYAIDACRKMNCSSSVDAFKVKLNSLNGVADAIKQP